MKRHLSARGFRLPALVLALVVTAGVATPVANAAPPPPQVSSHRYPAGQPGGGVGVAGAFDLDADYDVVKYVYSFTNDAGFLDKEVLADADGRATIRWTPRSYGEHRLFVSALSSDGSYSEVPMYEFYVLPGGSPAAYWALDGTLTDTAGTNALTAGGNPDLATSGYSGRGVRLNDVRDHLSGAAPVDTAVNFSLAAWVKVDDGATSRAFVATSDSGASSAGLYYDSATERWAFGMTAASDKAELRVARSRDKAATGVWTHLTGTYESTTGTLRFYVDGVAQEQVGGVEGWQAPQLLVGRLRWNGAEVGGSSSAVDEVKVHPRTVNDGEAKLLATQVGARAHYRFAEGTGGVTADEVAGRVATLAGATGWEQDGDYTSLLLNESDQDGEAYASAPAPDLRLDRSFTISGWARLDLDTREAGDRTVLSLVSDGTSLLDLRSGGASKKWEFVLGGTTVTTAYRVDLQEWTYLTAVHDAAAAEIRLYLNGVYVTSVPFTGATAQTASTVEFGRLTPATAPGAFWKGGIDDVRVYAGVLTQEQIRAQAVRY